MAAQRNRSFPSPNRTKHDLEKDPREEWVGPKAAPIEQVRTHGRRFGRSFRRPLTDPVSLYAFDAWRELANSRRKVNWRFRNTPWDYTAQAWFDELAITSKTWASGQELFVEVARYAALGYSADNILPKVNLPNLDFIHLIRMRQVLKMREVWWLCERMRTEGPTTLDDNLYQTEMLAWDTYKRALEGDTTVTSEQVRVAKDVIDRRYGRPAQKHDSSEDPDSGGLELIIRAGSDISEQLLHKLAAHDGRDIVDIATDSAKAGDLPAHEHAPGDSARAGSAALPAGSESLASDFGRRPVPTHRRRRAGRKKPVGRAGNSGTGHGEEDRGSG
jgi:hypothetical protein